MTLIDEVLGAAADMGFPISTIELIAPTKIADPNEAGRQIDDWTPPIVVDTVQGSMQPASHRALERAGMLGKINVQQIYCQSLSAMPEGRVRVDDVVYVVRSVSPWNSEDSGHTEMLVEAL